MHKMKNKARTIAALLLVLAMSLGLTACGGSGGSGGSSAPSGAEPTATPEYVYVANFESFIKDSKSYVNPMAFSDNGFYATSWEKVGTNIPEGAVPEYEGQYDVYRTFVYFVDNKGNMAKLENYEPMQPDENTDELKQFSSGSDLSGMIVASDGSLVTVEYVYTSWYDGPDGVSQNSEEYWSNQKYSQKYYLRWMDADGTELSRAEIQVDPDDYLNAYNMKLDDKGNVVLSTGQGLRAIAKDGTESYSVSSDGYVDSLVALPDGSLAVLGWSDQAQQQTFSILDTEKGELGEGTPVSFDAYNAVTGNSDYDMYYTSGVNFYGFNLDEGQPVKLFNWLSCDVNGQSVGTVNVAEDGTITCFLNDWDQATETYSLDKVTVTKAPYDSVPHKQTITMAAMYLDYNVLDQIVAFNRSNDEYRIEVTDYSEYATTTEATSEGRTVDTNAGAQKLYTEILAGNVPDLLCLSGLNYTQLASKGILEDLYPFIDGDKELDREDFFQNVLTAMEVDGKLCATVSNYYISTVLGSAAVVGKEPGWTYDDFDKALASMPEGCTAFDVYVTRNEILQNCLALDMDDFVDWSTGQCSFDSQQFVDLLEFANQFPAEFDWDNYDWSTEASTTDRLAQGQQMLVQTSLYSLDDIMYNGSNYVQSLGGDITYVGFPTLSGTGNMLGMSDGGFAMSSKSQCKDACWDFLRVFFTDDYQRDSGWSLPSSKAVFEEKATEAGTVKYQQDEDGNYLLDKDGEKIPIVKYSIWDQATQTNVDIYSMAPEQIQQVRDLISTTTKVADYNSNIFDIVNSQVSAYFEGQKTAQDVAKLVQSKANIYVNEQR